MIIGELNDIARRLIAPVKTGTRKSYPPCPELVEGLYIDVSSYRPTTTHIRY